MPSCRARGLSCTLAPAVGEESVTWRSRDRPHSTEVREMGTAIPGGKGALFNSGAEAIENAAKFARAATGRPALICFEGSFHGRTLLTMSLTSRHKPYKTGFGPFAPEVYRLPYPYPYRSPDPDRAARLALDALERA